MAGVSFVVTVFNKEREIEACARSLFSQSGDFEREYLFVDDGSTDQSPTILHELIAGVPGARVVRLNNNGPARALNAGVRAASFPLVKPVDGDDVLAFDAVALLLRGIDSGADIAFGRKVVLTEFDNPSCLLRGSGADWTPLADPIRTAIDTSLSGCSELLFRRATFLDVGGCDESLFIQDQSYIRRMIARHASVMRTEEIVAFSPPSPGDALCRNVAQIDHDNNAALMGMVVENPDLPAMIKRLALRKCASRAWKWLHRAQNKMIGTDRVYWTYLRSYIPGLPVCPKDFESTLVPYRRYGKVRAPGVDGLVVLSGERGNGA